MPVKQLGKRPRTPNALALTRQLTAEWNAPDSAAEQPIILEQRSGQAIHVYVVWDDWASLSGIERSEIIVDAFEQRYGRDESLNVTVAMGLTKIEADRLGISYS